MVASVACLQRDTERLTFRQAGTLGEHKRASKKVVVNHASGRYSGRVGAGQQQYLEPLCHMMMRYFWQYGRHNKTIFALRTD